MIQFRATLYFSEQPDWDAERLMAIWSLEGYRCVAEPADAVFRGMRGESYIVLEPATPADLHCYPDCYPALAEVDIDWEATYCVNPRKAFRDFQQARYQAELQFCIAPDPGEPRVAHNEWLATLLGIHQLSRLQAVCLRDIDLLVGSDDLDEYLDYANTHTNQTLRFAPMLAFASVVQQRGDKVIAWSRGLQHFGHADLYVEETGVDPFLALTLIFNTGYMVSCGYRYRAGEQLETEGYHCLLSQFDAGSRNREFAGPGDSARLRLHWQRPQELA